jgi:Alpha/beta hydrolase family
MGNLPRPGHFSRHTMHRISTLTGTVLLALLPCSCQSPPRAAEPASAGSLSDALATAQATSTGNTAAELKANAAATQRAAILWFAQSGGSPKPLTVQGAGRTWTLSASWPENLLFDELTVPPPVSRGAEGLVIREGAGAPLIARWRHTPERKAKHPFLSEGGYAAAVTATLDFRGSTAALRLHDPRYEQTVVFAGRRHPLMGDFNSLERWIKAELKQNKQLGMSNLGGMRRSVEYLDKMGLITLDPPLRDRIPLVLIHGLMSRPLTWNRAAAVFNADPEISRRYQIYYYRYPTGVPVIISAGKCRDQLAELKQEMHRIGNNVHRGRIILVGHSMGGLVTKSQVQSSGKKLWEIALGAQPEELGLPSKDVEALRPLIEFEPNRDISRVVFVCTPHRGSKLAEGFVGAIGRKLIKLPFQALNLPGALLRAAPPTSPVVQQMSSRGVPSSIQNLSPESLYVKASNQLPFRPGLHIHSIVGNKKGLPLDDPKCSDGAVPYTSAHLDNVESELVVRSGHSAHENPEAIAELRRILYLHGRQ